MQHAIGARPRPRPRLLHRRRRAGAPGGPAPRARARLGGRRDERVARTCGSSTRRSTRRPAGSATSGGSIGVVARRPGVRGLATGGRCSPSARRSAERRRSGAWPARRAPSSSGRCRPRGRSVALRARVLGPARLRRRDRASPRRRRSWRPHRLLADGLLATFVSRGAASWPWPEPTSRTRTRSRSAPSSSPADASARRRWSTRACAALDWLIAVQTAADGPSLADRQRLVAARRRALAASTSSRSRRPRSCWPRRRPSRRPARAATAARWSGPTAGSSARTTSASTVADPTRGAGRDGLTPPGVEHEPGRRVDAHVADRARARPGPPGRPAQAARADARRSGRLDARRPATWRDGR